MGTFRKRLLVFFVVTVLGLAAGMTIVKVKEVFAQHHNCGSCCDGSIYWCERSCGTTPNSCYNSPDATPQTPTNLAVSGTGVANQVRFSWTAQGCNETNRLRIDDLSNGEGGCSSPDVCVDINSNVGTGGSSTHTYDYTGTPGRSYRWYVRGTNLCSTNSGEAEGPAFALPQAGAPSVAGVTLAYGEAQACTDSGCNGQDMIVDLDANNNRVIPIRASFYDATPPTGSRYTDIQYAWIIFDNNADYTQSYYKVRYVDYGDGTFSLAADPTDPGTKASQLSISGGTRSRSGSTLYLDFNLNVSAIPDGSPFISNIYLNASDFISASTGRVLKVGIGDFADPPADYCSGNARQAVELWNGTNVSVTSALSKTGNPAPTVASMTTNFNALSRTNPGTFYLPYNTAMNITSTLEGYYVSGSTFTNFRGSDNSVSNGTASNTLSEGGVRQVIFPGGIPACITSRAITVKYEEDIPTLPSTHLRLGLVANGDATCTDTGCNNRDLIVYNDTNRNQQVDVVLRIDDNQTDPFRAGTPASRYSDIETAGFIMDTDITAGGEYLMVSYTDARTGACGSGSFTVSGSMSGSIGVSNYSCSKSADTLTLQFRLNLANIPATGAFLTNVYVSAMDFANQYAGGAARVLAASNVDVWNGRDTRVTGAFYEVSAPSDICAASRAGLTQVPNMSVTATYAPNNAGSWPSPVTTWTGTFNTSQPYHYYNNALYNISYRMTDPTSDYFLVSLDTQRYGGSCYGDGAGEVVYGQVQNAIYRDGGITPASASFPDAAFGVVRISGAWSESRDGNFFTNGNLTINIMPVTCATCRFTQRTAAQATNGVIVANGTVNTAVSGSNVYGNPNSWRAQTGSGIDPFTIFQLPTYQDLLVAFEGETYNEFSGNRTFTGASPINPAANNVYFISGDLTANSNFTLADNQFALFIVGGNLIVPSNVTRLDGLFLVQGNGTIQDNGTPNYDGSVTTEQFELQGGMALGGTLTVNRTMGVANNYYPPVIFTHRPNMIKIMEDQGISLVTVQKLWLGEF